MRNLLNRLQTMTVLLGLSLACVWCSYLPAQDGSIADQAAKARKEREEKKNAPSSSSSSKSSPQVSRGSMADQAIAINSQRNRENNNGGNSPQQSFNSSNQSQYPWQNPYRFNDRCPRCGQRYCRCPNRVPISEFPQLSPTPIAPPMVAPPMIAPIAAPNQKPMNRVANFAAGLRRSNRAAQNRADTLIHSGDEFFGVASYRRAALRYQDAVKSAPDYWRARLRLAYAHLALEEYDQAIDELLLAVELAGPKMQPDTRLIELYGQHPADFQLHLKRISDRLLRNPNDGSLQMEAAMMHYCNQDELLAQPYFEVAAKLPGIWQPYCERFLPPPILPALAK